MPGASSPWVDSWAPPQFTYGSSGASGPVRSPSLSGALSAAVDNTQVTYDGTLHIKLAGTVIAALIGVFVLQAMGFRFVVAVGS